MSSFPDYYALLNISKNASSDEIRTAYKKESLKCVAICFQFLVADNLKVMVCRTHPDRLTQATPAEKKKATEKFQVSYSELQCRPGSNYVHEGCGRCILCAFRHNPA